MLRLQSFSIYCGVSIYEWDKYQYIYICFTRKESTNIKECKQLQWIKNVCVLNFWISPSVAWKYICWLINFSFVLCLVLFLFFLSFNCFDFLCQNVEMGLTSYHEQILFSFLLMIIKTICNKLSFQFWQIVTFLWTLFYKLRISIIRIKAQYLHCPKISQPNKCASR